MPYEITVKPQPYEGDDEGFIGNILEGIKSIPHLPNAILHGMDEEGISPEESKLRHRAVSEAALWVIPALVTPAAAGLLRAAPALVRGVIAGAVGLGIGQGASAAAKGEDVPSAALTGAGLGAALMALGGLAGVGADAVKALEGVNQSTIELANATAAKLASERGAAAQAKAIRFQYRTLLGRGMDHEQIIAQLSQDPEVGAVGPEAIRHALGTRPQTPPPIMGTKNPNKGMQMWAEQNWPYAEAAGLSHGDFVRAAAERGIPAEETLTGLKIPRNEWTISGGSGLILEQRAMRAINIAQGTPPSLSTMSVEDYAPNTVSRIRGKLEASVPTVGISAPETTLRAADDLAATSMLRPSKKLFALAKAGYQASDAPAVFDQASMLLHRALAPARATLSRMGGAGIALAEALDGVFLSFRDKAGADVAKLKQILEPFGPEDRIHIGEIMEGIAIPRSPAHDKAAELLADVYEGFRHDIDGVGVRQLLGDGTVRKFRGRDLYLTHYYDPKIIGKYMTEGTPEFEEAMAYLKERMPEFAGSRKEAKVLLKRWIQTPYEFRTGPINYSRLSLFNKVPYEKDPLKAMSKYAFSVRKRIETARVFGGDDKGVLDYYEQMKGEGQDYKIARNIYDAFVGNPSSGYYEMSKHIGTFNTVTMLGFTSGLVQPGQLLNTAARVGYSNLIKAIGALQSKAAREWVTSTGAHLQETIDDLVGMDMKSDIGKLWVSKVIGLEPLDKANRVISALAGRFHAEQLAAKYAVKPNEWGAQQLIRMGIKPEYVEAQGGKLTNDQLRRAALVVSLDTQFGSSVMDLPEFKNTLGGRFIYQFKSFALQQTSFIQRDLLKPAMQYFKTGGKSGSLVPLMRYAGGIGPTGWMIGSVVRSIKGRPAPDDIRLKMLENAALAGGFGIWYDAWHSMEKGPNDFISFFAGPTAGNIAQFATGAAKTVEGDPSSLAEAAVRRIPLIGQPLANYWLYPPKKP